MMAWIGETTHCVRSSLSKFSSIKINVKHLTVTQVYHVTVFLWKSTVHWDTDEWHFITTTEINFFQNLSLWPSHQISVLIDIIIKLEGREIEIDFNGGYMISSNLNKWVSTIGIITSYRKISQRLYTKA